MRPVVSSKNTIQRTI